MFLHQRQGIDTNQSDGTAEHIRDRGHDAPDARKYETHAAGRCPSGGICCEADASFCCCSLVISSACWVMIAACNSRMRHLLHNKFLHRQGLHYLSRYLLFGTLLQTSRILCRLSRTSKRTQVFQRGQLRPRFHHNCPRSIHPITRTLHSRSRLIIQL